MREIKFRSWGTLGRKFVYFDFNNILDKQDELFNINGAVPHSHTIMQYTGLKDKNGVEIYEGDIFKRENCWPVYKVVFEEGAFMLENHGMLYPMHSREIQEEMSEILGNIYQNPELMEVPHVS